MMLPHEPGIFEAGDGHVRVKLPDRHMREERRGEGLNGLLEPAFLVIPRVTNPLPALDKRPFENASTVEIAGVQHLPGHVAVLAFRKLVVNARRHLRGGGVGSGFDRGFQRVLVRCLPVVLLSQQSLELLDHRSRQARLRRGLNVVVPLSVRRE